MEDVNEIFEAETQIERDNFGDEQAVIAAFGDDEDDVSWSINAYRIPKDGGKDVALFREPDPRILLTIMDRLINYGTGNYRIVAYRNGKIYKKMIYPVEAPPMKTIPENRNSNSDLALVLTAMREEQAATRALLERAMERPAPQAQTYDPMAMMERTLGMAASLAGIRPEQNQNVMTPDAMITLITKGMEIANTAKGSDSGGAGETNWMDLVKGFFASPLAESIAKSAIPQNPAPTQSFIPAPQIQPQQPSPQDAQAFMLQQIIETLGRYASQGTDPGAPQVLDWFFMNVPEAMIDALLREPNVLDRLGEAFPVIRERRGWFTAFLTEVHKASVEPVSENERPNSVDGDTGRSGGGAGNPQSNETPAH